MCIVYRERRIHEDDGCQLTEMNFGRFSQIPEEDAAADVRLPSVVGTPDALGLYLNQKTQSQGSSAQCVDHSKDIYKSSPSRLPTCDFDSLVRV